MKNNTELKEDLHVSDTNINYKLIQSCTKKLNCRKAKIASISKDALPKFLLGNDAVSFETSEQFLDLLPDKPKKIILIVNSTLRPLYLANTLIENGHQVVLLVIDPSKYVLNLWEFFQKNIINCKSKEDFIKKGLPELFNYPGIHNSKSYKDEEMTLFKHLLFFSDSSFNNIRSLVAKDKLCLIQNEWGNRRIPKEINNLCTDGRYSVVVYASNLFEYLNRYETNIVNVTDIVIKNILKIDHLLFIINTITTGKFTSLQATRGFGTDPNPNTFFIVNKNNSIEDVKEKMRDAKKETGTHLLTGMNELLIRKTQQRTPPVCGGRSAWIASLFHQNKSAMSDIEKVDPELRLQRESAEQLNEFMRMDHGKA